MGCTNSKGLARKRTATESWYAPLSRSTSAPIHCIAEVEDHGDSSSFNIIPAWQQEEPCTFASLLRMEVEEEKANIPVYRPTTKDSHVYPHESQKRFAFSKSHVKYQAKLNPVEELSDSEGGHGETIEAWELMRGPDEAHNRMASPLSVMPKPRVFEKSPSFNTVYELDSYFGEAESLVKQRSFVEQGTEGTQGLGEDKEYAKTINGRVKSPAKTPNKSPLRSPWKTPVRSPLKSPMMKSPFLDQSSPLFDPSLMARFEQAIQEIAWPPQDDWLLTSSSINEGSSMTTVSPYSINNNASWVFSESSSEDESPQSMAIARQTRPSPTMPMEKAMPSQYNASSWDKGMGDISSIDLHSFEYRCPPNGEGKVVLYFTSLRAIRKTYEDGYVLRLILQGLGVDVDERDVWMHSKFGEELSELLGTDRVQVPRLFIKGRYIGGVEDVHQLHEDGSLTKLFEDLHCVGKFKRVCDGCAGMRFIPCLTCWGSCKVLDEESAQVLRCAMCNENGLIMCPLCK